jgi:hypothetical protein
VAAPNFVMKQLFIVQQRDDTRWHVCEIGFPRSLASFGLKDDAIEYARELAGSWDAAEQGAEDKKISGSAASEAAARIGVHA